MTQRGEVGLGYGKTLLGLAIIVVTVFVSAPDPLSVGEGLKHFDLSLELK